MEPTVRQIRNADIDGFYETFALVVNERRYLAFLTPPPIEMTRAFVERIIEKGYPQLVAVADTASGTTGGTEQIVGWCDITPPGREVMAHVGILGIAVHPDWRGRGIGERLMRASLDAADAFGFTRIELGVFSHNTRAQTLYRKLGFVEEGVKRSHILIDGTFHDQVMMARLKT